MQNSCKHCGQYLKQLQRDFCCNGCSIAYRIICDTDLSGFYNKFYELAGQKPKKAAEVKNELDYSPYIHKNEKAQYTITLMVEGIECGACIWLIENFLLKEEKVLSARVNLTTKRLTIIWSGNKQALSNYIVSVNKLGYKLLPYDPVSHERRESHQEKQLLKYLAVAGFGFLQTMMVSIAIWAAHWTKEDGGSTQHILHILTMLISSPCIVYSARVFAESAYFSLCKLRINMDLAIIIAVLVTTCISVSEAINNNNYTYFDSVLMLMFFLLVGKYTELKVNNQAGKKLKKLLLSQPQVATVKKDDDYFLKHVSKVRIGDFIYVATGERIALDGVIEEGNSEVDFSIINGESMPQKVKKGDEVFAGSVNIGLPILIKITKAQEQSLISEIIKLVEKASLQKSNFVKLADKVSSFYTPLVLFLTFITFIYWLYFEEIGFYQSTINAVSVLLVTCPCALALAIPTVYTVASISLLDCGILLKSTDALEKILKTNEVFFDKTGTLTYGSPRWINKDEFSFKEQKILKSLVSASKHPLCKSIAQDLLNVEVDSEIKGIVEQQGAGVKGLRKKKEIKLGNRKFVALRDGEVKDDYLEVWLKVNGSTKRLFFQDQLREEALEVITKLKNKKLEIKLLSGDRESVVKKIAKNLKIANYNFLLTPEDKFKFVQKSKKHKRNVLMIGDGLNDSAAIKLADCSMSPTGGIDLVQSVSDIVYTGDLKDLLYVMDLAQKVSCISRQNIIFSVLYNIISISIAFLGFITPVLAAALMSSSSLGVVMNSLRIKRLRYNKI